MHACTPDVRSFFAGVQTVGCYLSAKREIPRVSEKNSSSSCFKLCHIGRCTYVHTHGICMQMGVNNNRNFFFLRMPILLSRASWSVWQLTLKIHCDQCEKITKGWINCSGKKRKGKEAVFWKVVCSVNQKKKLEEEYFVLSKWFRKWWKQQRNDLSIIKD